MSRAPLSPTAPPSRAAGPGRAHDPAETGRGPEDRRLLGGFRGPLGRFLVSGWPVALLIALGAAWLRLAHVGGVEDDPFYDAAVRSMSMSWHNFFFGAMEPGGSVSIDKPPLDLWLQVASVKLFGFGSATLKLPQALGGSASALLLFGALKRPFGLAAGLAGAAALAVLPIAVITSRSDTMDAVMGALLTLALLCVVRAGERGRTRWLLAAAAVLGLAFNVKLTESLVALPGLLVMALLVLPGPWRRRSWQLGGAVAVYVLVSLAWLLATLAFPAHDRPWAYGSTNGSAWNASFSYNGMQRISGEPEEGAGPAPARPAGGYPQATQAERDAIPITEPSAGRLLTRVGPLSGERLGLEVLAAVLLILAPLASLTRSWWLARRAPPSSSGSTSDEEVRLARLRRGTLIGLLVWLAVGIVLFSTMARLHPRYTEGFTTAVAACLGIGAAWATERLSPARTATLAVVLAVLLGYAAHLLFGLPGVWWVMLAGAVLALALAGQGRGGRGLGQARWGVLAGCLICVLAIPLWASLRAVREDVTDSNSLGVVDEPELGRLSTFLKAHQKEAYYEAAYDGASKMGALVVRDGRPILVLTTTDGRVLTPVSRLARLAAEGRVRYAILTRYCTPHAPRPSAECSAPAEWVRRHGRNVSSEAGLGPGEAVLWKLPGKAIPGARNR